MGAATYALWQNRLGLAAVALFFVCLQGSIFGPSKYGLLPELLPTSKLSWGNGVIELTTLLAAIGGTLAGGLPGAQFSRPAGVVGLLPDGIVACGSVHQPGHHARACRGPATLLPLELGEGTFRRDRAHAERRGAMGRGHRQHLLLVFGRAAASEYRALCHGHPACGRSAQQLPAGGLEPGHWRGQLPGGLRFGTKKSRWA